MISTLSSDGNMIKIPPVYFTIDGSVELSRNRILSLYNFSLSLLGLSFPLPLFVPNPVLWFPGSARLSISSSLHLSAAAEPGPHHPTCQSLLYTFNPSDPSFCKATLHTVPLLLSKQPPPQKHWDPPLTLSKAHTQHRKMRTFTHKNCLSLEQRKRTITYKYKGTDTHIWTHKRAGQHCIIPIPSFGTLPLLFLIPLPAPLPNKPFPTFLCQSFIQQKRSQITALDLSFHLRHPFRFFDTYTVWTLVCKHHFDYV